MEVEEQKFFTEYEDLEVHEIMIRDRPRQEAYCKAIMSNKEMFENKIVMDVGAGSGILSAFCAKAGAKLVYAIEASNLAKIALQTIDENNLTQIVKVIHSKVEEFQLPSSAEKVDIIVSEWMGFYLLHEGMLDTVLYARDKFLKPNGLIFPSEATIYIAPCSVPSRYDFWNDVDGVKMNKFAASLRAEKSKKPEILEVHGDHLLHKGVSMFWMNLEDVNARDLDEIVFQDVMAVQKPGKHQGFCIWFECRFPSEHYEDSIILSTSPRSPVTHWKQCVVVLPEEACEDLEEGAPIAFKIEMKRQSNDKRKYNLIVSLLDSNTEEHPVPCDCILTKCILTKAHLQAMDCSENVLDK